MFIKSAFDFLFPPICINCGKETKNFILEKSSKYDWICDNCLEKVVKFKRAELLHIRNIYYNKFIYIFEYRHIIRKLIIKYKFKQAPYISNFFSEFITKDKKIYRYLSFYDIIVPVPMSKEKRRKRGYNQTELIAKKVAKTIGISYKKLLYKKSGIATQSTLLRYSRSSNIRNAFYIKDYLEVKDKNIILLDDIFTTGATAYECAKVLKEAGAKDILVVVIAKD